MRHLPSSTGLALCLALLAPSAWGTERTFAFSRESQVLGAGSSELSPWTTFRVGRERYFSAIDGRLQLDHGLTSGLSLALYWNFTSQTEDVVGSTLTGELERVSSSELASASAELKYQLTDAAADALGSGLMLAATVGSSASELEGRLILDRELGALRFAGNLTGTYRIQPLRDDSGTSVATSFILEPTLAAAYVFQNGLGLGLELRAPLGLSGDPASSTLFGGPVVSFKSRGYWLALGVQPQLVAFSGSSPDSSLDLEQHERLEVRLMAGFLL